MFSYHLNFEFYFLKTAFRSHMCGTQYRSLSTSFADFFLPLSVFIRVACILIICVLFLLSALSSQLSSLISHLSALCSLLSTLCSLPSALCALPYSTTTISSTKCPAPANLSTINRKYRTSSMMLRHWSGSYIRSLMVPSQQRSKFSPIN